LTPYYQSRMKELSNQQRKIVELLVDRRHPVMVKDIAADCFIEPGTAASQLRDLRKMGYVEAEQNGRESFYELREVLMRLCLEVKKQRGQWVEIFVEFLRIWYSPAERQGQLEKMRGQSRYFTDEHLEKALLSDDDPCFTSSRRDFLRAMQEQQRLVACETLEEMRDSQRLTTEEYQKLLALVKADRYSEAQQLWTEIVDRSDRSAKTQKVEFSLRSSEGWMLLEVGQNLEALEIFDSILTENNSDHSAWHGRGYALDELGRHEEAIASYDQAITFKPDQHEAWNNRGTALDELGRHEEAIASYDQAITFKPDQHEAWYNRGNTLVVLGRYEEAIASYDQAIKFKPDFHNQGWAYLGWEKYPEAIACLDHAIAIKSDQYESWYDKGVVQFVMGNSTAALASWQQSFQIIQQLTPRPTDIAGLIQEFIKALIPRFTLNEAILPQIVPIYQTAEVLPELSTALINTLPQILSPSISDHTADRWLDIWHDLLGSTPALETCLRLMSTAIAYKKQPDQQKRLWLGLAKEERMVLDQILGAPYH
jgi:tetratricopeptide (TPR) repeat protein